MPCLRNAAENAESENDMCELNSAAVEAQAQQQPRLSAKGGAAPKAAARPASELRAAVADEVPVWVREAGRPEPEMDEDFLRPAAATHKPPAEARPAAVLRLHDDAPAPQPGAGGELPTSKKAPARPAPTWDLD